MTTKSAFHNKYSLVKGVARRARQLQSGAPALGISKSIKACRVAQDEIAAGKVGYLKPETPILKPEIAAPDIPKFVIS